METILIIKQIIKDIRKIKKRVHKINVKYKYKVRALEAENVKMKSRLEDIERELSYCKKYDLYYDD